MLYLVPIPCNFFVGLYLALRSVTVATVAVVTVIIVRYFSKNNWTPQQLIRCSQGAFHNSRDVLPGVRLTTNNFVIFKPGSGKLLSNVVIFYWYIYIIFPSMA